MARPEAYCDTGPQLLQRVAAAKRWLVNWRRVDAVGRKLTHVEECAVRNVKKGQLVPDDCSVFSDDPSGRVVSCLQLVLQGDVWEGENTEALGYRLGSSSRIHRIAEILGRTA